MKESVAVLFELVVGILFEVNKNGQVE